LTRQHILEAAAKVVQREGVAHLTLDAVAKVAGVSKGGVLYHFATKEALVEGMLHALYDHFTDDLDTEIARNELGPGQWVRAYIRASTRTVEGEDEVLFGLLAAIATNPQLLEPLRQRYRVWQEQAEGDGLSPPLATVIRLAVDGLWFADMFGFAPPGGLFREDVIQQLLALSTLIQNQE